MTKYKEDDDWNNLWFLLIFAFIISSNIAIQSIYCSTKIPEIYTCQGIISLFQQ